MKKMMKEKKKNKEEERRIEKRDNKINTMILVLIIICLITNPSCMTSDPELGLHLFCYLCIFILNHEMKFC